MNINYNREVWEGWTIKSFIRSIEWRLDMIMEGNSFYPIPGNKEELSSRIIELMPYYRKHIPEVVEYFSNKYDVK